MNQPGSLGNIGKYVLLEEIGYGGFAAVYKAHDTELERTVALKVMHPYWQGDEGFSERFRREAHTMERLHHPNIVSVYESGAINGQLYIAMEYLPGPSLHDALKETPFPLERAVEILAQIASALDYAHHQGVIHRDIKPANVILTEVVGEGVRATLLDFGLVKAMSGASALTSQGMLIGSPEYMAPEQVNPDARRYVGPAADRYALGVMAYRMFTGRVPFPGNTPATLNAHENKPVPPPQQFRPDLPDSFVEALLIMLSKGPEARFATASAFVAQLRAVLDAQTYHQERAAQLSDLYACLKESARSKRWDDVLTISERIHAIDRDYRDVKTRMLDAKRESAAQERARAAHSRRWRWIVVGGMLLTLLAVWAWSRLSEGPLPRNPALGDRWTRSSDAMDMVYVSPGAFLMGAADGDPDERPVHTVMLAGFWLDRTEVSEAQYGKCVTAGKCSPAQAPEAGVQYPVRGVTWENAHAYCVWAGARLPTEAEWEYAYRGPESRLYPWGDTFDPAALNFCDNRCADDWAMTDADDGYAEFAPAGAYPDHGSWCSALDLAGNLWEWVGDWYGADAYATALTHNPTGPASGAERVLRGGSWRSAAYNVRGSYRFSAFPNQGDATWGFRCAR